MKKKRKYTHSPEYYDRQLKLQERKRLLGLCDELEPYAAADTNGERIQQLQSRMTAEGNCWAGKLGEAVKQRDKVQWELAKAAMLVDLLSDEVCHLREDLKKK